MKIVWFSFSLITAECWHRSLPEAKVFFYYDKITRPPGLLSIPPDREMLDIARNEEPNLILFCGIADGSRLPSGETFRALKKICPVVMLSGDLSDPPWWPYLETLRYNECFNLYVNFDGNDSWPKSTPPDFTALTPIAHEFYPMSKPLKDRLVPFGFGGAMPRHRVGDHQLPR